MSSRLLFFLCQMSVILLLRGAPTRILWSPCPDVFAYERNPHGTPQIWTFPLENPRWRAVVTVRPVLPIFLKITLLVPAFLPSKYVGRIEMAESKDEVVKKIKNEHLDKIRYFVYFPANVPIPELISIEKNSRVLCSQVLGPRRLKTVLTLEHSLVAVTANVTTRGGEGGGNAAGLSIRFPTREKEVGSGSDLDCGQSASGNVLNSGRPTVSIGDWPWMVPLFKKTELGLQFFCSSTLVSTTLVVTAAHCVKAKNFAALKGEEIIAYVGRFDITNWTEENSQPREISEIFIHPDFDSDVFHSDLAVLKLSKAVKLTPHVAPVCLWRGNSDLTAVVGLKGIVFGWGTDGLGNKVTPTPKLAIMPIVSQEECLRSKMEFLFLTTNRTLCAGYRNGTGPCSGDSGGGLLIPLTSSDGTLRWYLRGVVSLSLVQQDPIMCDVHEYTVFTDVAKYQNWLNGLGQSGKSDQWKNTMNVSPKPKTPIRTPQPGTSTKALQLTPIWEEVVRNNRLPPGVSHDLVFKEIGHRLEDLEWPVRQHAFRVLCDIIPVLSNDLLDERIIENNILTKLIVNLGHPAPGVRKVASETIQKYLKQSAQSEKMLEDYLQYGVREVNLVSNDAAGIPRENVTLGTIASMADVLRPFIKPGNGGYSITQEGLTEILEALSQKLRNPLYRDECLVTLWKLRDLAGNQRFGHALSNVSERDFILHLMKLQGEKDIFSATNRRSFEEWSDETRSDYSYEEKKENLLIGSHVPQGTTAESSYIVSNESSEDFTDGTDTDTYTKEPAPDDLNVDVCSHSGDAETTSYLHPSFVPVGHLNGVFASQNEQGPCKRCLDDPNSTVLLEAEIQLSENKAITMKVTQEDDDDDDDDDGGSGGVDVVSPLTKTRYTTKNGDLIMKVLHDNNEMETEEKIRTPRRVRFGGEVIKLRTPDSDTTDITIEIHEPDDQEQNEEVTLEDVEEHTAEMIAEKKRPETRAQTLSQIPVPVAPATSVPKDISPSGRIKDTKTSHVPNTSPKNDSTDLVPSSSGSETETKDSWSESEESVFWQWTNFHLVEENIIKDLENKKEWRIQYQALEHLKLTLINPKTLEKLGQTKRVGDIESLFKCLLYKVAESNNQQVVNLALSTVSQLVETLPSHLIGACVHILVRGLCRYFGGSRNLSLKIESVQSLKTLFGILRPSSVIDVLLGDRCLFSSVSKIRENSLLAIMYAAMTFPSTYFDVNKILQKVTESAVDNRRRVRHAALEAVAIFSQFCSPKALTDNIAMVAKKFTDSPTTRAQFIAAVQARLSRRLLPSISGEGLVLYALQIPASRRFGNSGNPMGSDIDWILSGTGSMSTGSAKSRTQLNAAQRLDFANKNSVPLSPRKWVTGERKRSPSPKRSPGSTVDENPWTIQKNRNAENGADLEELKPEPDTGKPDPNGNNFDLGKNFRAEDITWALVPLAALEESHLSREKNHNLWGEDLVESGTQGFGPLRPLYLKLQPTSDRLIFSRSSEDVRKFFSFHDEKKVSDGFNQNDVTEVRLLTPTVLREKNSESTYLNVKRAKNEGRCPSENPTRIPVLFNNQKSQQKGSRASAQVHNRRIPEADVANSTTSKPSFGGINSVENGFSGFPAFLPSIHSSPTDIGLIRQKSSNQNKFSNNVDETKLQDTMTQLSGLLTNSKNVNKLNGKEAHQFQNQALDEKPVSSAQTHEFDESGEMEAPRISAPSRKTTGEREFVESQPDDLSIGVASAPSVASTDAGGQVPSTSSSNSTDSGIPTASSELKVRKLANDPSATDVRLPYRNYRTCNSKQTERKLNLSKTRIGIAGNTFPETLKPFDRPKEGLDTCFSQLESQQWEVNMLGLTSLVRLLRYHPAIVLSQLHPIICALGKQIKNLRSQVARAACQVSAEMFLLLKRNVEPDLDELSGPLLHRSADTNRFIRADCNDALDNMIDSVGPGKAVSVIISKGATHQNATVRAVASRLLLRLSEKVGPEKLLSLPKEIRDKMLQTGANLLTEGKLETRAFAKQVFRLWSSHPSFSHLMLEAVPPNVMRNIGKTLISLKS